MQRLSNPVVYRLVHAGALSCAASVPLWHHEGRGVHFCLHWRTARYMLIELLSWRFGRCIRLRTGTTSLSLVARKEFPTLCLMRQRAGACRRPGMDGGSESQSGRADCGSIESLEYVLLSLETAGAECTGV
jgi:hypothetical protein